MLNNKSLQQDLSIVTWQLLQAISPISYRRKAHVEEHFSRFLVQATFQEDFRAAVDREARADLVEKRKQTEAELEAAACGGGWLG